VPTKMGGASATGDLHQGCVTQAWLATSEDELARSTGGYFYINALVRRIRSRATSVLRRNCSRSATGSLACFLIDPRPGLCRTASPGSRADRHAQTASGCDTADMRRSVRPCGANGTGVPYLTQSRSIRRLPALLSGRPATPSRSVEPRRRANPGDIERLLLGIAEQDGKKVRIGFTKDPGQAGKRWAAYTERVP